MKCRDETHGEMILIQGAVHYCVKCKHQVLVDSPPLPMFAPIELSPEDLPCPHRGKRLGEERCILCGLRDAVTTVYACDIHGRCTVSSRGIPKTQSCVGCLDLPLAE